MRYGLDRGLLVGILLLAAMTVGVGVTSYLNTLRLRDNADRVAHSRKVFDAVNAVQFDTVRVQAALRVYLVTGFEEWVPPYHQTVEQLRGDAARLTAMTADDPSGTGCTRSRFRLRPVPRSARPGVVGGLRSHERLTFRHAGRHFRLTDVHGHVVRGVLA